MKIGEAKRLLQVIAAVDGRAVSDEVAGVWAGLLDDVALPDALEAMKRFFRDHPDKRIAPGHVRAGALLVAQEIRDEERRARRKTITMWGFPEGDPRNEEARAAHMAMVERREREGPLPPAVTVVDSPYRAWEQERRLSAAVLKRAESPIITDTAKILEIEEARARYLTILGKMMEDRSGEEVPQDQEAADA